MNDTKSETTVWVANDAGHPYYKVKKLTGEGTVIKPLTQGNINTLRPDRLTWHLARGIAKFVDPDDVLLISGSPIVNAIALTTWLRMHSVCRMALWDAKARKYVMATLESENIGRILQEQLEG